MKILVTGATGLIGKPLCRMLIGQGHEVNFLSRNPEKSDTAVGAKGFRWLPEQGPPPGEALEAVDAVIHLAGEPVAALRWNDEQKKRIRDSRVIGTRQLVEAIKGVAGSTKTLVSASAVGYYGDRGNQTLDERSDPGKGFLSDVCVEWERETSRAAEAGVRVVVVRVGIVLSKSGGVLERMLPPFRLGLGGPLGSGKQWFPWIHLDDVVGIFNHALRNTGVTGPLNAVAPGIVDNGEFAKQLAGVLHRPVIFSVPEFALKLMMGEMADVVLASQRVNPVQTLATGYGFKFESLRPALYDLLSER